MPKRLARFLPSNVGDGQGFIGFFLRDVEQSSEADWAKY